ncbi:alpha/beta hydrolase [Sphingomonas sp.]|uniref:alpha/beta fold hydrolase n=1 Tax=Sphingomonas sp. TaxID=28214 RepID=UPI002ED7A1AB
MHRRNLLLALTAGTIATTLAAPAEARAAQARAPAHVAARDGTRLAIRRWGRGRPIVFTHSWALDSTMWSRLFLDFAERGFECIGFDRRGHGRSDAPPSGYDMDTLADDLAAVIGDRRDVILVGHSMGAAEILRYAQRHGTARIARIVLLAPVAPFLLKTTDNAVGAPEAFYEAIRAEWRRDFPKWIEANKAPFFTPETSVETMDAMKVMMLNTWLPAAIECNRALIGTDLRPALARVDKPTLVIHGTKDASAPIDITGRPTAAGIRGASLRVYEGAPHGLFATHHERVRDDILAFVGSTIKAGV